MHKHHARTHAIPAFLPRSGAELKSAVSRVIARCMHSTKLCMAEGPEVTTLTAAMRRKFRPEAYKLTDLQIISGRYENTLPEGWQQLRENLPLSLHSVHEKGKFIYFRLERGISLWSTLGMSGSWTMRPHPRFLRMRLLLERANYLEGKELLHLNYADKVEFGTFKVCFDPAELEARLNKLGPSWLHGDVSLEVFRALLKKKGAPQKKRSLAVFLMDQTKTCGIGNYILSEALYAARIHPWAKVGALNDADIDLLYKALSYIIWTSAETQEEYSARRFFGAGSPFVKEGGLSKFGGGSGGSGCGGHFDLHVYGKKFTPNGLLVLHESNGPHKRPIYWVPKLQTAAAP